MMADVDRFGESTAECPVHLTEDAFRRGYGTFEVALERRGDEWYIDRLADALELGFRHFDTAQGYGTEEHVAAAIERSDVSREEVFIATKLHWQHLGYDDAIESAHESRERLDVDTIDLLYVHVPVKTYDPDETLPALDALVDEGVANRIGLSNFLPGMLETAIERLEHDVFAHQVEMHPLLQQRRLHALAREHGHWLIAFSPFMKGLVREIRELRSIAASHDVTPFAVSLAWLLAQPNVGVLSHSTTPSHMRANIEGDLPALDDGDYELIASIDREYRMWDGRIDPWNRPIADESGASDDIET